MGLSIQTGPVELTSGNGTQTTRKSLHQSPMVPRRHKCQFYDDLALTGTHGKVNVWQSSLVTVKDAEKLTDWKNGRHIFRSQSLFADI